MQQRSAFTLIELLVVLAVIGILAAILFPVFGRVRENARRSSCTSNAKQIALAATLYAGDYNDRFVPVAYKTSGGEDVQWPQLLQPYAKNEQIFRCPSDNISKRISYGLNAIAFADFDEVEEIPVSRSIVIFDRPAETLMLGETGTEDDMKTPHPDTFKLVAPDPIGVLDDEEDARPAIRHFDMCTVAFLDGHVKPMRLDRFYVGQNPPEKFFAP